VHLVGYGYNVNKINLITWWFLVEKYTTGSLSISVNDLHVLQIWRYRIDTDVNYTDKLWKSNVLRFCFCSAYSLRSHLSNGKDFHLVVLCLELTLIYLFLGPKIVKDWRNVHFNVLSMMSVLAFRLIRTLRNAQVFLKFRASHLQRQKMQTTPSSLLLDMRQPRKVCFQSFSNNEECL